ncbi:MAG: MlaD family protein [Muribaculaceae bacterium]|nr:MlaD family protein [Muribaculaceae bacterium]
MKKNFIIGLCVAIALVILFFGIEFLKGVNIFKASNNYYSIYTNVEGLSVSAPVTVNGFKVGQVSEISYMYDNPGHVRVDMSLDKDLVITEGTAAVIKVALLGTASVELSMGDSDRRLESGSELLAKVNPGMMDAVTSDLLPGINSVVPHVDALLSNVNGIVTDPALAATIKNLESITSTLSTTMSAVNNIVKGVPSILSDVNEISSQLKGVAANMNSFTAQLSELPLDSTLNNVRSITENLVKVTDALNNTESTVGKLLNEDGFYDNLNSVARSLDSLLTDIKRNPKRYISIKLL